MSLGLNGLMGIKNFTDLCGILAVLRYICEIKLRVLYRYARMIKILNNNND